MSAATPSKNKHDQSPSSKSLSTEDLARVNEYLSSPVHQIERSPFKPLKLLGWLLLIIIGLGVISRELGNYFMSQLFGGYTLYESFSGFVVIALDYQGWWKCSLCMSI
ncbi:DUF3094 family protein [Zooshikella ganghwensis]|uniref:DUF3094 family protein n=2 Tax=Zooshikella ganghwensis TaxID=202772 RepID=A0A4P9VU97_9GAMM|nr:DUF3094 family protein [Zooshikella ganghwensis]RDH46806.1 DUF3094 family protein [Zooshikella ganghwensis]